MIQIKRNQSVHKLSYWDWVHAGGGLRMLSRLKRLPALLRGCPLGSLRGILTTGGEHLCGTGQTQRQVDTRTHSCPGLEVGSASQSESQRARPAKRLLFSMGSTMGYEEEEEEEQKQTYLVKL